MVVDLFFKCSSLQENDHPGEVDGDGYLPEEDTGFKKSTEKGESVTITRRPIKHQDGLSGPVNQSTEKHEQHQAMMGSPELSAPYHQGDHQKQQQTIDATEDPDVKIIIRITRHLWKVGGILDPCANSLQDQCKGLDSRSLFPLIVVVAQE